MFQLVSDKRPLRELLLVRIVRGPGQKGQKGWGQLWVLGGSAPVPRKETSMKAGPYLCLTQPAERLCVMRVQLKKDRLSFCPDGLFLFIYKLRMNFFQIIYKSIYIQLSSFPKNYITHPQDSKIMSSQKSYPKDKSEWENTECSCLWVADCKRIYRTEIISSLSLLPTTASTTYITNKALHSCRQHKAVHHRSLGNFSFVFRIVAFNK